MITALTIIYGILLLSGAAMVAMKKKSGFVVSNLGCLLQIVHVVIDPTVIGLLPMSPGFMTINTLALRARAWKDEKWL